MLFRPIQNGLFERHAVEDPRYTAKEREALKGLDRSDFSSFAYNTLGSIGYQELEDRYPQLGDIYIPEMGHLDKAISVLRSARSNAKISSALDEARRELSKLTRKISSLISRVLQEEFEDTYFRIDIPYTFESLPSERSVNISYSWKEDGSWKHRSIRFFKEPEEQRPISKRASHVGKLEEWHHTNRSFLIRDGYFQLRDYLGEMETGGDLPDEFNLDMGLSLLPEGRRYDHYKHLIGKRTD